MTDLALELARRFYEIHEKLIFSRIHFSRTSLKTKMWEDLNQRDQLEYVESFRQLLADQKLMVSIRERAEGL
jgi:hypothetical protein